jgi:hypothetical protein
LATGTHPASRGSRLRGVRRPGLPSAVDLFGPTRDDFIGQVKDIITVGEFYDLAAGGQIIFT